MIIDAVHWQDVQEHILFERCRVLVTVLTEFLLFKMFLFTVAAIIIIVFLFSSVWKIILMVIIIAATIAAITVISVWSSLSCIHPYLDLILLLLILQGPLQEL